VDVSYCRFNARVNDVCGGMQVKLREFLGAGLPTVATPIGARVGVGEAGFSSELTVEMWEPRC
jgi:hypothetical protein